MGGRTVSAGEAAAAGAARAAAAGQPALRAELVELVVALDAAKAAASAGKEQQQQQQAQQEVEQLQLDKQQLQEQLIIAGCTSSQLVASCTLAGPPSAPSPPWMSAAGTRTELMLSWWDTNHAASHDLFTPYMHARQLNQLWQPFNQSGCGASQLTN